MELEKSTQVFYQHCISQHGLCHSNKQPPDLRAYTFKAHFSPTENRSTAGRCVAPCQCLHSCIQVDGTASVWDMASLEAERKEDMVNTPFLIKFLLRSDTHHFPSHFVDQPKS